MWRWIKEASGRRVLVSAVGIVAERERGTSRSKVESRRSKVESRKSKVESRKSCDPVPRGFFARAAMIEVSVKKVWKKCRGERKKRREKERREDAPSPNFATM